MTRPAGWETAFAQEIEVARSRTFAFGDHDCVTFACRAASAAIGRDVLGCIKYGWDRPALARTIVRMFGGIEGCLTVLARMSDLEDKPYASRGNLGVLRYDGEEWAAVCTGDSWAIAAPHGFLLWPLRRATRIWGD